MELSKSNTFEASISATVSYSGLFVGGSVTATAGYSMTNASSQTDAKESIVSDQTTFTFPPPPAGVIGVLWVARTKGTSVPWSASFTPTDDQVIEITARRLGRDDRFTGKLPWIQMKTYLPEARRTFTVNGTFDVNKFESGNKSLVVYEMAPEDVAMVCRARPPVQPRAGYGDKAQASAVRPSLGGDVAASARHSCWP